jgi:hypothetical protein
MDEPTEVEELLVDSSSKFMYPLPFLRRAEGEKMNALVHCS